MHLVAQFNGIWQRTILALAGWRTAGTSHSRDFASSQCAECKLPFNLETTRKPVAAKKPPSLCSWWYWCLHRGLSSTKCYISQRTRREWDAVKRGRRALGGKGEMPHSHRKASSPTIKTTLMQEVAPTDCQIGSEHIKGRQRFEQRIYCATSCTRERKLVNAIFSLVVKRNILFAEELLGCLKSGRTRC